MKATTLCKTLLAGLMLGGSAASFAAIHDAGHSSNLKVEGYIVPVACDIKWPGGSSADFGEVKPGWDPLKPDLPTYIGERPLQMAIHCEAPTRIAIGYKDDKASSVPAFMNTGHIYFGLGTSGPLSAQIGAYRVSYVASTLMVDNVAAHGVSTDNGINWLPQIGTPYFSKATGFFQGFEKDSDSGSSIEPSLANDMSVTLRVQAYLNRKADFPTGSRVKLDGLATIILNYVA